MKNIKLEKKIMKIVRQYQPILLLQRNTFELKYGTENPKAYMECLFNYPYLNVTLHYSDEFIKKYKKNEDIIHYVVHEITHWLTRQKEKEHYFQDPEETAAFQTGMAYELLRGKNKNEIFETFFPIIKNHFEDKNNAKKFFEALFIKVHT